jgi:hypothetical protein
LEMDGKVANSFTEVLLADFENNTGKNNGIQ